MFDVTIFNPLLVVIVITILFGSFIGYVANIIITNLPVNKPISLINSYCSHCKHKLSAAQMIPIISYIQLKGRCLCCSAKLKPRYIITELLSFGIVFSYVFPQSSVFLNHHFFIFSLIMLIMFFTDIEHCFLSFYMNIGLFGMGIVIILIQGGSIKLIPMTIIVLTVLLLIRLLLNKLYKRDSLGIGDILLISAIFINWGPAICISTFYLSCIFGGLICVLLLVMKKKSRLDSLPFGPYLIFGFYLSYFFLDELILLVL